eukprot:gnl/MRDRNA2_/MRDRNA2_36095_c0_seq1.p1 gnl/MRDRNA2_/MRDRNA2_36095_c0~~gnl/MRDRNA2_/MRDRNA2_36095_c0_seq1.p1  ORF type:complete len:650 (+),score=97.89 gnl/MRDRNA2_/MRDRNA2_36095_c0_seq1:118-2067(+)
MQAVIIGACLCLARSIHYAKAPCAPDETRLPEGTHLYFMEFCAPHCTDISEPSLAGVKKYSCPTDVPHGVTASPECRISKEDRLYCVLHCKENQQCDEQNGATCSVQVSALVFKDQPSHHFTATGMCVYPMPAAVSVISATNETRSAVGSVEVPQPSTSMFATIPPMLDAVKQSYLAGGNESDPFLKHVHALEGQKRIAEQQAELAKMAAGEAQKSAEEARSADSEEQAKKAVERAAEWASTAALSAEDGRAAANGVIAAARAQAEIRGRAEELRERVVGVRAEAAAAARWAAVAAKWADGAATELAARAAKREAEIAAQAAARQRDLLPKSLRPALQHPRTSASKVHEQLIKKPAKKPGPTKKVPKKLSAQKPSPKPLQKPSQRFDKLMPIPSVRAARIPLKLSWPPQSLGMKPRRYNRRDSHSSPSGVATLSPRFQKPYPKMSTKPPKLYTMPTGIPMHPQSMPTQPPKLPPRHMMMPTKLPQHMQHLMTSQPSSFPAPQIMPLQPPKPRSRRRALPTVPPDLSWPPSPNLLSRPPQTSLPPCLLASTQPPNLKLNTSQLHTSTQAPRWPQPSAWTSCIQPPSTPQMRSYQVLFSDETPSMPSFLIVALISILMSGRIISMVRRFRLEIATTSEVPLDERLLAEKEE